MAVIATVPERWRQIEAVHAYWRLAEAVGGYHFDYERQQRLASLRAASNETADLRTAQAIAAAQVREAEVRVAIAQHDLAEILSLIPGSPLPLPADTPLVGPYRTLFAELFAGRTAPQRLRTLDQTLPLRNRAVESHAAALLAAEDALDATIELQTAGREPLSGVLSALDAQNRQQRAFWPPYVAITTTSPIMPSWSCHRRLRPNCSSARLSSRIGRPGNRLRRCRLPPRRP